MNLCLPKTNFVIPRSTQSKNILEPEQPLTHANAVKKCYSFYLGLPRRSFDPETNYVLSYCKDSDFEKYDNCIVSHEEMDWILCKVSKIDGSWRVYDTSNISGKSRFIINLDTGSINPC